MEGGVFLYFINLKHRKDRWKRFSQQPELKELMKYYKYQRFEAVNGSTIDVMKDDRISLRTKRNIKGHIRRDHEELNTVGGVGCYLSHTSVWKKFLERDEKYAIVLEDDAELYDGFTADLQSAMKDTELLPQMPDVWFFESKDKPSPPKIKGRSCGPWIKKACSTFTGYLVSKQGAKKLLETAFPMDMHIDLYTCLSGDMGRIFTVMHRNVLISAYSLTTTDTDIHEATDCAICNIPTKFEEKGNILVNIPIMSLGLALRGGLYYLGGGR